ncbi:tetratricopeptide repeat protein [Acinetobacter sp. TSRC1-2]|uniref:tetratricopeptide repeat protein n=1 Tax=unclassified Acinetobacter TaxID=196816 RepID=UPI003CF02EAE
MFLYILKSFIKQIVAYTYSHKLVNPNHVYELTPTHYFEKNPSKPSHSTSLEDDRDARNAIWNFLSSALKGQSEAQFQLGLCYLHGQLGLDKNYTHAEEWLKKAAKQGHHEAQITLEKAYGQIVFS